MLITQKELDEVVAANPELGANGLASFSILEPQNPIDLSQVDLAIRWLDHHGRRGTVNPSYSSYGLKHFAENTVPALRKGAIPYISNGAFIAAALYLNYRVVRIESTPNARINISFNKAEQKKLMEKVAAIKEPQFKWMASVETFNK